MNDTKNYNISIRFGSFDGEDCFEARVRELPDLVEYADTYTEAYELAVDSISATAKVFCEKNLHMPSAQTPFDDFSGRVTLRLPKSLHRSLAHKAENEGISLNQLLVSVLSAFRGFDMAISESGNEWMDFTSDRTNAKTVSPVNIRHLKHYDKPQSSGYIDKQAANG